jgi:hypothetical protein
MYEEQLQDPNWDGLLKRFSQVQVKSGIPFTHSIVQGKVRTRMFVELNPQPASCCRMQVFEAMADRFRENMV